MTNSNIAFSRFAEGRAPFRALAPDHFAKLTQAASDHTAQAGQILLEIGDRVDGLYVLTTGRMDLISPEGETLQQMHAGDVFGHRSLLRDSDAVLRVQVTETADYTLIKAPAFHEVVRLDPVFASFFSRSMNPAKPIAATAQQTMAGLTMGDIMTPSPQTLPMDQSIRNAASLMAEHHISCVMITGPDTTLAGIITSGDLVEKIIANGISPDGPVSTVMTANPHVAHAHDTVLSAVMTLTEERIAHMPVVDHMNRVIGIVTQTDLVQRNSNSMIYLLHDIARQNNHDGLASIVARAPKMFAELVGSGIDGHQVGRLMTGISDAVTKRLIALAINQLGPPPVNWLWLACGSQGREEQTGVSDQDNCLFLSSDFIEAEHGAYFDQFTKFVSDGLNLSGYEYCPGDMMATNPKWRQPIRIWQNYFNGWIEKPDPMAQMLASVMFDLRPIAGDTKLFGDINRATLKKASKDSIFRSHMIANSLKHTVPLGLFGGLSYVRDGTHKKAVDMKHSGVVPITDLARAYALTGQIESVNTRDRLIAARDMDGVLSTAGGNDLIDAYDLILGLRLEHQTRQIRAGQKPDNYLVPDTLSALERNHLKDAFSVVKGLQSAAGYGKF